jgi:hypothetical protein
VFLLGAILAYFKHKSYKGFFLGKSGPKSPYFKQKIFNHHIWAISWSQLPKHSWNVVFFSGEFSHCDEKIEIKEYYNVIGFLIFWKQNCQ